MHVTRDDERKMYCVLQVNNKLHVYFAKCISDTNTY
jgi:hypothetical protein